MPDVKVMLLVDVNVLDNVTVPLTGFSTASRRVNVTPFVFMDWAFVPKKDTLFAIPEKVTPDPNTRLP